MVTKDKKQIIQNEAEDLLKAIGVSHTIEVEEEGDSFDINIESAEEKGLLIGQRGDTLLSIQLLLTQIVKNKLGEWARLVVNVGDWREKQETRLIELAQSAAQRAVDTNTPQPLYNLNSSQRRTIHLALSDNKSVTTESIGEGNDRYLLVKPK